MPGPENTQELIGACKAQDIGKVSQLLATGGAVVDEQDENGKTPLMWAGWSYFTGLLIEAGAKINIVDNEGMTALMWAANNGHKDSVELLIKAGSDINRQDKRGMTALMWAANCGQKDIAYLLIKADANADIQCENGRTALIEATCNGHKDVVQLLINVSADTRLQDKEGKTALMWAESKMRMDVVELLKKADDYDLHYSRGAELAGMGNIVDATQEYINAIKIDYNRPIAHYDLGLTCLMNGDKAQAISEISFAFTHGLEDAVSRKDASIAHANLAGAYVQQGLEVYSSTRAKMVREAYREGYVFFPQGPVKINDRYLDDAERELRAALALDPNNEMASLNFIRILGMRRKK